MKKMMFAKKTLLILFLILLMNCDGQTAFAQSRTWVATGSIVTGRYHHTATLLSDGKVLVVGGYSRCSFATGCATLDSAELYNPVTGTWSAAGRLRSARSAHLAVRLPGGKVLVAGGGATPVTAELYDPATGAWTPTGNLNFGRFDAVGMLLPNGKVLVAGGATLNNNGSVSVLNSAELYDPATGVWTLTGNLNIPRLFASATLLTNGKVLLAGGESNLAASNVVRSAELYDLATGAWTLTGSLNAARQTHPAVLLQNGKVLVTSGFVGNTLVTSAELYDPVAGAWSLTGSSGNSRETATLLPNGQVLATGADGGEISTEIYNPATGLWRADANLTTKRNSHTATLLQTGKVLIVGGTADGNNGLGSAELYDVSGLVASATTVSAAGFQAEVAGETIAALFGANLAADTIAATTLPLPTMLGGVTVRVKDSGGTERDASLFFVSPGQINYLVPAGTLGGTALVSVISNGLTLAAGPAQVATVAPGLFSANATGQGLASAVALRVRSGGAQSFEAVSRFDAALNRFVAVPIDLGAETDQVFLLLFGTGLKGRSSPAAVSVTLGGISATVEYAGPQGDFAGLDQVNLRLPRTLAGRGEVNIALLADGKAANVVTVNFR